MRGLKRIFLGLVFAIGMAIWVLGALRSPPPAPEGFTRIQYWEKWSGSEAVGIRQIVDSFNETVGKEKHIYVELVSMSLVDQKTMVATAAGVPPDVAGLWDTQLNKFAALDALEPLDDLAKSHGLGPNTYKPIYWKALTSYRGRLWGMISTPASIALHYNKQVFIDRGFDPERGPASLAELDDYAERLTTYQPDSTPANQRIKTSGFLPIEPGWYVGYTEVWFGGLPYDGATGKLQITGQPLLDYFKWLQTYPRRLGKGSITDFRSGLGTISSSNNPFFTGEVAMVQQGPWYANYVESFAPQMNRWNVAPEKVQREKDFSKLTDGMTLDEVKSILGAGALRETASGAAGTWDAGIKTITAQFDQSQKLVSHQMDFIPAIERKVMTQWGVVPYPSAVPGAKDVTLCPFDVLAIPRGSKHKKEAFEFIAYVNRQDVMERLCSLHCKNSPLQKVSDHFLKYHPNPYIDVFERLAASPNAVTVPSIPIWPEVLDEITVATQKCFQLENTPEAILENSSKRLEEKWADFQRVQAQRHSTQTAAVSP